MGEEYVPTLGDYAEIIDALAEAGPWKNCLHPEGERRRVRLGVPRRAEASGCSRVEAGASLMGVPLGALPPELRRKVLAADRERKPSFRVSSAESKNAGASIPGASEDAARMAKKARKRVAKTALPMEHIPCGFVEERPSERRLQKHDEGCTPGRWAVML